VSVLEARDDSALDVGTWIVAADGAIVERPTGSSPALDAAAVGLTESASGASSRDIELGEPRRLLALPVNEGGRQVATIVTSTSLSPYRQVERLSLVGSAAVAVLLVVIVHLVLRANVTRALRPVQQMTAQAGRWSDDDVQRRFGAAPRPAELAELAETLDQLLDRLAAVIRHEQRFSEELSHELRTPLARVQAEIDLLTAHRRSDVEVREAYLAIDRSTRAMASILDTMMSAARSAASAAVGRCRLDEVLARVVDPDGRDDETLMVVDCPPGLVVGVDADVVLRALSPVVVNARRFAHSRVDVRAARSKEGVVVTVGDDGPGMTEEVAARAFEPGFRGDPEDGHPGAGLGLALVRRLVVAAGGTVQATPSPAGGRVTVTLPPG
jgi:signal transduction histidine kinase